MFRSRSKTKDDHGSSKPSQTKKVLYKTTEQNQSNRMSQLFNSVPSNKKSHILESPVSSRKNKMTTESSHIPRPIRITSFVSDNDSIDRSTMDPGLKDGVMMEGMKKEIQELRSEYQNIIKCLQKENKDLEEAIATTKREIYNLLREQNETLKKNMDQLEVEMRMLNKSIFNTRSHYIKFVPFVMENILTMMKNQKYLEHRISELEHPRSYNNKFFQSSSSSYCNTPSLNSFTYSISISPVDEKNYYKLVFSPFDDLCISKFNEEAQEQVISLPVFETISPSVMHHSYSSPNSNSIKPRKIVLGTKTIPYYLKRLNHTENESLPRSVVSRGPSSNLYNLDSIRKERITALDLDLAFLDNFSNKRNTFKDLKKRYLKLKLKGLIHHSYPCINPPTIENDLFKKTDGDCVFESATSVEIAKDDSNLNLCQSDTDMFGEKFQMTSSNASMNDCQCCKIQDQTVIYQQLSSSTVQKLRTLNLFEDDTHVHNNPECKSNEFSLILPRSQLSSLLSHNFSTISSSVLNPEDHHHMDHDDSVYTSRKNTLKPDSSSPRKIDDSDYFTFHSSKNRTPVAHLASFETLSDEETYMDDDYCQQVLIDAPSISLDYIYDSDDRLYSDLDRFHLPNSSLNDILQKLTK